MHGNKAVIEHITGRINVQVLNYTTIDIHRKATTYTVLGTQPHIYTGIQFTKIQIHQKYKSTRRSEQTQNEAKTLA